MNAKLFLFAAVACLQAAVAANVNVPAGGNLQSALNAARPGDTITLAAGASYVGHFVLAPNPGPQWITIQSSAMNSLPAAGNRVSNTQSAAMPKLVSPDDGAVLLVPDGANYYHLIGLEFQTVPNIYVQDLIDVGTASDSSTALLPHDIDFDRDYIHGDPIAGGKRGIALNGGSTIVENCYVSGFVSTWQDTQALYGWDGPGPYKIINNYLEAGTETVAFGGATTSIPNVIPSDILVQNNTFFKPLSWMAGSSSYAGVPIWAKNHFELKNAQRVTIDSNTFTNNWQGADQPGYTFVFTVRTEYGAVPWAVVRDITVTNNIINHSAQGAVFAGHDNDGSGSSGNFVVQNNVWEDINSSWGGNGHLFVILDDVQGVTLDHNTAFQNGAPMLFDIAPSNNITYTNNITMNGWGVVGDGTGMGIPTLNGYASGWTFAKNVLIGGPSNQYPANNFFPSSVDQVGFTNVTGANFQLSSVSAFKNAGTDGKDIGMDQPTASAPLMFIPVTPCRVADTRNPNGAFGGPALGAGAVRNFSIPSSACGIPSSAAAYSLNVTAVPSGALGYITVWPAGQAQPLVSTLNSDGRIKANAAIVPAGANGAVSIYASDATHVVLDIDGYFVPAGTASALAFYPVQPCRVIDSRQGTGALSAGISRSVPIAGSCNIPAAAQAYSLNFTAVPRRALGYLTVWAAGQSQPTVSTLNAPTGTVTANAAIVPAGNGGSISVMGSDATDLIIDANGYFAPPGPGGLSLYTLSPCRVSDSRAQPGSGPFSGTRSVNVVGAGCSVPAAAQAYVMNATVVPSGALQYLTLWADGQAQPFVSTLNAFDAAITSNMAIVGSTNGSIDAFGSASTQLILDVSSYFAP